MQAVAEANLANSPRDKLETRELAGDKTSARNSSASKQEGTLANAEGNVTFTNKETVAVSRTKALAAANETAAPDADKTQGSLLQAKLPKQDKVFFAG